MNTTKAQRGVEWTEIDTGGAGETRWEGGQTGGSSTKQH